MLTVNAQFETEIKRRIAEEVERVRDILAEGLAIKDFSEYKYHVGRLHGLRDVANSYCDEVATILNKR